VAYGWQRGRVARLKIKENPLRLSPARNFRDRSVAWWLLAAAGSLSSSFAVDQVPLARAFRVHEVVAIQRRAQGERQGHCRGRRDGSLRSARGGGAGRGMSPTLYQNSIDSAGWHPERAGLILCPP
jgi:hypothetical protein